MLSIVARRYTDEGFDFSIVTSAKNMIYALNKNPEWLLCRYSANQVTASKECKSLVNTIRDKCKTASFFYVKRK